MANETETDEEQLAESEAFNPPRGGMVDETPGNLRRFDSVKSSFNPPRGGMVDETQLFTGLSFKEIFQPTQRRDGR